MTGGFRLTQCHSTQTPRSAGHRDVAEFELLIQPRAGGSSIKRLVRATSLYRGDFLENCYSDWCQVRREILRERLLRAHEELADQLILRRRYRQAVKTLHDGLAVDNSRESLHRQLMLAHALSGDKGQALIQYQRCVETLENELGVPPSPATAELHQRITGNLPLD